MSLLLKKKRIMPIYWRLIIVWLEVITKTICLYQESCRWFVSLSILVCWWYINFSEQLRSIKWRFNWTVNLRLWVPYKKILGMGICENRKPFVFVTTKIHWEGVKMFWDGSFQPHWLSLVAHFRICAIIHLLLRERRSTWVKFFTQMQ